MRGQVNVITMAVIIFIFIIGMGTVYWVWGQFLKQPQYQQAFNSTPEQHQINNGVTNGLTIFNNAALAILIIFGIVSLLLAAASSASPAFLVISILLIMPEALLSFMLHDAFFSIVQGSFLYAAVGTSSLVVFQYFTAIIIGLWVMILIGTSLL
jgi:hypothetical protein